MNKEFYHQTVTTQQIESFLSKETGIDLTQFFEQYLRTIKIPTLEYKTESSKLKYRYTNIVPGFDMPIKVTIANEEKWLYPTSEWKEIASDGILEVDRNFYIKTKAL
jgi:aminopeptidase N